MDLQLSGHTHRGQLFPNNLITGRVFETDWGYWRKDNLQLIVSSGFGTWGPPIRTGNRPEIVDIHISFKSSDEPSVDSLFEPSLEPSAEPSTEPSPAPEPTGEQEEETLY